MKLTRATSYAIHAVVFMAVQKEDKPIASHLIAQARNIPERFLLKVLKPLVSAQVLLSIKGPNGGYRLAKAANEITMLEVLEAVDGPIRGYAPFSRNDPHMPLNRKLDAICNTAADVARKQLGKVKISDLASRASIHLDK
jgi:Rrf2 family protein